VPPNVNTLTFQRTDGAARGVLVLDAPLRVRLRSASLRVDAPVSPKHATLLTLESTSQIRLP
jgi:hypothetical protein